MPPPLVIRLACLLVFGAAALTGWAASPTKEEIAAAIERLGDDRLKVREEATNFLWSAGKTAEPALQNAGKSPDAEVAWRARKILEDLKYGIHPDTPAKVRRMVRRYQNGDVEVKQSVVMELLGMGGNASGVLSVIIISERDENIRRDLLDQMGMKMNAVISDLILNGNAADGNKVLELVLAGGKDFVLKYDAVFCLLVVDLAPKLEERDRKKEADEIFSKVFDFLQKMCADHPRNASCHNNLAWMSVVCRRQMEEALAHSQKAVELDPKNPAFLDTLAEIRFQRKEIKEAVELMKKCIQLAPKAGYFRKQLKRFEAGDPTAERPDEAELFFWGE